MKESIQVQYARESIAMCEKWHLYFGSLYQVSCDIISRYEAELKKEQKSDVGQD